MRAWHFAVWVITVMAGALYTIIQTGPDTAGENLCKLARKIVPSIPDQCVPAFVQWGPRAILAVGLIFGILVIWDFVSWIRKYRPTHPKQPRARYHEREIGLIETMWWVAERSAWGRWQSAQRPDWAKEEHRLIAALSFVRVAALNGDLPVRARLKDSVDYLNIGRDFWRSAYIGVQPDNAALWKPVITQMGSVAIPDYDGFVMERSSVQTLWPKHHWQYDWRTAVLRLKSRFKAARLHMPEIEKKEPNPPVASEPEPTTAIVETAPAALPAPVPTPAPVIITPSPDAPEGWEKLFAVGDDGRSIWLHFLPDNKTYKRDTLILIVFGHKVLRNLTKVRMAAVHAAVEKTIDNAPGRPFDENPWMRSFLGSIRGLAAAVDRDYGEECVPLYLERVGLAQGGMYQLTELGESHARSVAYDLIRRA